MPRAPARIVKRYAAGVELLDFELEGSLVWGEGIIGTAIQLRTLEDWQAAWDQWRHIIEPKVLEHRPGTRAFAAYVCGEIPERDIVTPPPLSSNYFKLYVPSRRGSGRWHYRYPPPYMRTEWEHLHDLGLVDAGELKRGREWRKRRTPDCPSKCQRETYPLEQGLYV
jgi:hypothetical protein